MRRAYLVITLILLLFGCTDQDRIIRYDDSARFRVPTEDGWYVSLIHLPPKARGKDAPPVLLCHGLSSTTTTWDLGNGHGLAPFLQAQGYDIWMLNLRGRKDSARPGVGPENHHYDWTFDDYARYDVPAAIEFVLQQTNAPSLTWIGHSMGGMVAYAHLGLHPDAPIAKLVTIGSPVTFSPPNEVFSRAVNLLRLAVKEDEGIPAEFLSIYFADATGIVRTNAGRWVCNPDYFCEDTYLQYVSNSLVNLSGSLIRQFFQFYGTDIMRSRDGKTDYRANLRNIRTPLLALAGKQDHIAPVYHVYPAYEEVSSKDKTFFVLGQVNGTSYDPGHGGIVLGDGAKQEIYPVIARWMAQREPISE